MKLDSNSMAKPRSSKEHIWTMFDRIASHYDPLNRLLSFGQDVVWRKRVASHLPPTESLSVLDLATGTADQILFLCQKNKNIVIATGIDMAEKMLAIGRGKISNKGLHRLINLQKADVTRIPFSDETFDVVTMSFGIRNVNNVSLALSEMYRVLKVGGRAIILEFSLPGAAFIRSIYLFYFRNIMPRIGAFLSNDANAYRYLNRTVESFPYGEEFCRLMDKAGFVDVEEAPLTFGIATIYQGDKREYFRGQ